MSIGFLPQRVDTFFVHALSGEFAIRKFTTRS